MFRYIKRLGAKIAHLLWCPSIDDIDIRATVCPDCASKIGLGGQDCR